MNLPDDTQTLTTDNEVNHSTDLPDSPQDQEKMKSETIIMDMPEVKDIPGQEHVHVAPLGELADLTISSDDEEGVGILDELNGGEEEEIDREVSLEEEANITPQELGLLDDAGTAIPDDQQLKQSALDDEDEEGELLNEGGLKNSVSGSDLDVPGSEDDDTDEEIGEEDEENNNYSLGGDAEQEGRVD